MATEFERAFAAEYATLRRYLHRRLGREAAEDIVAETFAVAFARWDRFDQARPVRPWLFGIATNVARRHHRDEERKLRAYARTGVDPVVAASDDESVTRLDAQAHQRLLAQVLADLGAKDRELLLLHAWVDLADEEIASALGIPVGTVKSRLSRLRARLRNQIGSLGQLEVGG
jgi:RNA polymerase sigma-70 factor (ECF subfamily)